MRVTEEQMLNLGTIAARCDVARMMGSGDEPADAEAVMAGMVMACAILLPKPRWEAFLIQCDISPERLKALGEKIPGNPPTDTTTDDSTEETSTPQ